MQTVRTYVEGTNGSGQVPTCITNYAKRLPGSGVRRSLATRAVPRRAAVPGRRARFQGGRSLSRSFLTRNEITTSICITMLVTPYSLPATFAGYAAEPHWTRHLFKS